MNQNRNYQKEMERLLNELEKQGEKPKLLLHSCCAPCSSYVLEYLSPHFRITDFFYNPNIEPESEYRLRAEELQRLIEEMHLEESVTYLEGKYDPENFRAAAKGLEDVPEGGARCLECFKLRLEESAAVAGKIGADFFTTSLTISPLKNAKILNQIGEEMGQKYGVAWLPSDFKKKNGYKRSTELSAEYGLYRQNFCGCLFSKKQAEEQRKMKEEMKQQ